MSGARLLRAVALLAVVATVVRPPAEPSRDANRLLLEASPYLLQHAHNPVDWYPWGPEAFDRARREGKPVLLSIGYSTCHWCHVMAEESFEDEEIAAFLNDHYVAVKVDREARPDVDAVYMAAVQAMGVSGGWPLTLWLTPDRRPFYGGTYFPPRTGDRGARVAFLPLLERLHAVYRDDPARVTEAASDVVSRLVEAFATSASPGPLDAAPLSRAYRAALRDYDETAGGFGRAPKFPRPDLLTFLLRYHRRTGEQRALDMVVHTLDRMAAGGIRDHVGGGFHRYSTDAAWRVPHFEKMLPDNALLAMLYLEAAQATGRQDLAAVTRDVLDYLARDMRAPDGAFHAASDADSDGEEGRYFTWTRDELAAALPPPDARLAVAWFDVPRAPAPRAVLWTPRPLAAVAAEVRMGAAEADTSLQAIRRRLLDARAARTPPHVDRKVIAAWNGLAISAFARAGLAIDARYTAVAVRAADRVFARLGRGSRLAHHALDARAVGEGYLDDYAFLEAACLDLLEATGEAGWLVRALALQDVLDAEFHDDDAGGYFATSARHERLLVREKPAGDGAMPSGNAIALENLLRIASLTADDRHRRRAESLLRGLGDVVRRGSLGAPRLLAGLERALDTTKEIVIVGRDAAAAAPLLARLATVHVPNRVLVPATDDDAQSRLARLVPLLVDKTARDGATAYVCERQVCQLPTGDPDAFARALATVTPLP